MAGVEVVLVVIVVAEARPEEVVALVEVVEEEDPVDLLREEDWAQVVLAKVLLE